MLQWDWDHKKVLVTGGAGAIGSNLVARLVDVLHCDVTIIDDYSQGRPANIQKWLDSKKITFIEGSVNDENILKKAFEKKFEVVYHLAASFANELSVEQPLNDLETNIKGTLNLLLKSVKSRVKVVVYASSSSIYGPRKEIQLIETMFPDPSTPYAVSKLTGEFYCRSMKHLYGMDCISLRFSNTYGPNDYPGRYRNVIPNFMKCAFEGKPLGITGTGDEMRDYTYIDDCIDGIIQATQSQNALNQVFNLGTGSGTKTIDLAKAILEVTKSKSEIKFLPPRYFDHIEKRMMNVDKARKAFGYNPKTNLLEGLKKTYDWAIKYKDEILRSV